MLPIGAVARDVTADLSDDDRGRTVVSGTERIGTVTDVRGGTAHVDPDFDHVPADLADALGWRRATTGTSYRRRRSRPSETRGSDSATTSTDADPASTAGREASAGRPRLRRRGLPCTGTNPPTMLVLGDAHADEEGKRAALSAAYDDAGADVAVQAGDLLWYDLPVETWFVAGNNEAFDTVDTLRAGETPDGVRNAHLLASAAADVEGVRVAGLSGNYAPTQYDKPRAELAGDRRRHFVREDVERLADLDDVDVLVTHEAPTGLLYYGYDPGCERIDHLLDALAPDLCLVGHHHKHREAEVDDCRVVSLAPAWERYYTLDPDDLTLDAHETPE